MSCRPKRRQPHRGRTLKSRRTTLFENGTSGLPYANENYPNAALLGGRTNARQVLRLLLKNLNAKRLQREERRNETGNRTNAVTGENADRRSR